MVIYKTTNLVNNKIYIGKTTDNKVRYLGSGKILKKAIKKYGKQNFKKEIIESCNNKIELDEKEKFWIKEFGSQIPNGYNISIGGTGGNIYQTLTPEQQLKIRENFTKYREVKVMSEDNRQKLILTNTNRCLSEESRGRIGKASREREAWKNLHTKEVKLKSAESKKFKFDPIVITQIINAYNLGENLIQIGQKYNMSVVPIKRILKDNQVPKRLKTYNRSRKKIVNE